MGGRGRGKLGGRYGNTSGAVQEREGRFKEVCSAISLEFERGMGKECRELGREVARMNVRRYRYRTKEERGRTIRRCSRKAVRDKKRCKEKSQEI
jgi:hypothetical protein